MYSKRNIKIPGYLLIACVAALLFGSTAYAGGKEYTVKQDGTGDFSSIKEGADSVPSGSTLVIYEGIYNEHVDIINKTVNLRGVSREQCILQYDSENYFAVPLNIGAGIVSSLTIYGYTDKTNGNWITRPHVADEGLFENPTAEEKNALSYEGYAVHIDQNYLSGRQLIFDNCSIISENNHCVGCGLRNKCLVSFRNCEFRSYAKGGDLFVHDSPDPAFSGQSSLEFLNCRFYNYYNYFFFFIQTFGNENRVNLTFKDNRVHTIGYAKAASGLVNNVYNGRDVSDLLELGRKNELVACGYASNDLVQCYSEQKTADYLDNLVLKASASAYNSLPEGITLLLKGSPTAAQGNTFPMYLYNMDETAGMNGWCGVSNFYLTPDSCNNTFAEMNYYTDGRKD